jgi:hypothetical protein
MNSLATKTNAKDVASALRTLPKGIDDTYAEAMQRIDDQNEDYQKLATRVLSWVFHAVRPLSVRELREAVAINTGDKELDDDQLAHEDDLVSFCAGMVVIDGASRLVRLVHFTAQSYFERIRDRRFPNGQAVIAETCITYLSFSQFSTTTITSYDRIKELRAKYGLLGYAARHWAAHAGKEPDQLTEKILTFLEMEDNRLLAMKVVLR